MQHSGSITYKTDAVLLGGGNARGVQNTRGNVRPPTSWRSRRLSANSDQPSCCIVVVTLLLRPQVGRCSIDISTDTSDCYPRATLQASAGTSYGPVSVCPSVTSRCSIETDTWIELVMAWGLLSTHPIRGVMRIFGYI